MGDFNKLFWGFIFSAVGIALGWTLNQFGQWSRTRQEDKKKLKVVLFNLLEMYYLFVRSDIDKFVKRITSKLHDKIPKEHQSEESKSQIQNLLHGILSTHFIPEYVNEFSKMKSQYQESINVLSAIDPINAYYLNNKTNIFEIFDSFQDISNDLKQKHPEAQNEIDNEINNVMKIVKPEVFNDTLSELKKDIIKISWKINPYTWYKSKQAMNRLTVNATIRLDEEIEKLFAKLNQQ